MSGVGGDAAKLHKKALKLRSKLHPAVKISCNGEFTQPWCLSAPSDEHLRRRRDACDLTTYSIPTSRSWFRVFIMNSSHKAVKLCPVHYNAKGQKKELPSITVQPYQEGEIPFNLNKFQNEADESMQIFGDSTEMLLELCFRGVASRDVYYPCQEYPDRDDDAYFSADDGPRTPRAVSALAVLPQESYRQRIARTTTFDPNLHDQAASLDRMHALLRD